MQSPISMWTLIILSAIFAFAFSRHHHNKHHNNRIDSNPEDSQPSIPIYVPRVCPQAENSEEKWEFCPKPREGNVIDWPCVRYSDLCNGLEDCPGGSDEDPEICFFHQLMRHELNSMRKTVHDKVFGATKKGTKTEKTPTSNEWISLKNV